jgi:hypothetical protein
MTDADVSVGERPALKRTEKPVGFLASRSLPLVYVNIPKSACTTIKNILNWMDSGEYLEDPLTIHGRKDLLLRGDLEPYEMFRRLNSDLVFTFVRHPLRRAYSCFNEKIHFVSKYSFPPVRKEIQARYGGRFVENPALELHRQNFKAFLRFSLDAFQGTNGWRSDAHWCPQSMVLRDAHRWRMIDFIGRVEHFDAHLKGVLHLAGVTYEIELPRMNEGPAAPFRYEEVVDEEIRDVGGRLFAADLRNFGYSL